MTGNISFQDLPEVYRVQEAISKFSQGCLDKEAAKHACFEHPKSIQEALNAVKHHQYISHAVDGQKTKNRRRDDFSVNEITIEDVKKIVNEALTANKSENKNNTDQNKAKSDEECFFCKNKGHFKRNCRKYKAWLKRKEKKQKDSKENKDLN